MDVNNSQNTEEIVSQQEKIDPNLEQNKPVEKEEDPNWRAIREARKKDKAEREAAEKRAQEALAQAEAMKAAMEAVFAKNPPAQQPEYGYEETEDQKIEKKIAQIIAQREQKAEQERLKREKEELPMRLRQAFPDYDKVVNEENGAYLEYHHPELLRTLLRQQETFESLSDTYRLVKKLIPGLETAKKDEAKTQTNLLKPKSSSSPTIMQPGEVLSDYRISEEKKAANWARMQRELKNLQ